MNFGRPYLQPNVFHKTSKFVGLYSKLLQGISPGQIVPGQDTDRFFSDLLDLKVDRTYLEDEFNRVSKDDCHGKLKVRKKAFEPLSTSYLNA